MSKAHVAALEQAERLERISDDNLVTFFSQALQRIDNGEKATDVLNSSIIKNLIRIGMLEHKILKGKEKRGLVLTDKARGLLEIR